MLCRLYLVLNIYICTNQLVFSQDKSSLNKITFDSLQDDNYSTDSLLKKLKTKTKVDSINQAYNKSILDIKDSLTYKFVKLKTDSSSIDSLNRWHRLQESNVLGDRLSELNKKQKIDSLSNIFESKNKKLLEERDKHLKEAQITQKRLSDKVNIWSNEIRNLLPKNDTLSIGNEFNNNELLDNKTSVINQDISKISDQNFKVPRTNQYNKIPLSTEKDLNDPLNQNDNRLNTEFKQSDIKGGIPTDHNINSELSTKLSTKELEEIKS
ncbi:MAG: hypothetical protein O9294_15740, partial [Cytophagales bacterium]|nr:hypothetical protein [Cytophagales bacterium]